LVVAHLAAPLAARQSAGEGLNGSLLAELARRYAQDYDPQSSSYDFIELAVAAGLKHSTILQYTVKQINPGFYLGSGQFEELRQHAGMEGADLVAVNVGLTPAQQRNWEQALQLPVLSRYDIIFAIFEQNAHTAEGKLQVELARLRYELPRIVRSYEQLDPLAGGIGTLGPGEQLTERIKRRHRRRIHEIEQKLDELRRQRAVRRRQRQRSGIFIASIVGYTNVGKSTLLNRLTGSGVLVADQYFATLDPTARALVLPPANLDALSGRHARERTAVSAVPLPARGMPASLTGDELNEWQPPRRILLTDTVGFLDDLPEELVRSFRATLEEMEGASLLIHLADASHPRLDAQIEAVHKIITSIGLGETPELLVLNKLDRVPADARASLRARYPEALQISATTGEGVGALLHELLRRHSAASAR
jgi:GTP-binding protein HflX